MRDFVPYRSSVEPFLFSDALAFREGGEEGDEEEEEEEEENIYKNTVDDIYKFLTSDSQKYKNGTFESTVGTDTGKVNVMIQMSSVPRDGQLDVILQQITATPEQHGHGRLFFTNLVNASKRLNRQVWLQQTITPQGKAFGRKLFSLGKVKPYLPEQGLDMNWVSVEEDAGPFSKRQKKE
tara:strand:- start:70 stop:609 length:540 start_codon:yes stop_codon:yes gene_type:complete